MADFAKRLVERWTEELGALKLHRRVVEADLDVARARLSRIDSEVEKLSKLIDRAGSVEFPLDIREGQPE
jgi:hypothetical protein